MTLDGYIRVSQVNGRGGERFISPVAQREQIERYAAAHGHCIGEMFEELDQSGGKADRPLLLRALARQESGEAQVLCVARLDRFGRSLIDGLSAIERVTKAGGSFVSVADNLDFSSPTGRLVLRLMLSLAEWELDRVRNTWADAQARAIKRGVFTGSAVPLGYKRTKAGRLVIDEKTAPVVREVFAARLNGARPAELVRLLGARGVPSYHGGREWSESSVRNMIARRVYLGEVGHSPSVNPTAHEPLIDPATWRAAQLPKRAGPGPRRKEPALLSGLLRCAGCSRVLMTQHDEQQRLVYLCPRKSSAGQCPSPTSIFDSVVEPYVEAAMWGQLKGVSSRQHRAALAIAEKRAAVCTTQMERYRDHPTLLGTLGAESFDAGLVKRRGRLERALLDVAQARARLANLGPGPAELRRRWPEMELAKKRELIAAHLDCVFVYRGRAKDRLWAIPHDKAPADLPVRAPRLMTSLKRFEPRDDQARALPAPGSLDWSKRKTTRAIGPFLEGRDEWPRFQAFQAAGLALAYANAVRHQSVLRWADRFGVKPPVAYRKMAAWSEARVREELGLLLADFDYWPTCRQFAAAGAGELRKAVLYRGGAHRWATEMGKPMRPQQRSNRPVWTEESMRIAVRALAGGQAHWPTLSQFEAADKVGLYESIGRMGIRSELADSLGLSLPAGRRYRPSTRWTDEAIKRALDALLAGREVYPTAREFADAGLAGLFQKLSRQPGGHDAIAATRNLVRPQAKVRHSAAAKKILTCGGMS